MKVLAIDPGTQNFGWAILEYNDTGWFDLVNSGVLSFSRKDDIQDKLRAIRDHIIVHKKGCDAVAYEANFSGEHHNAVRALANVEGVIAEVSWGTPLFFAEPRTIKKIVASNGNASKEVIQKVVCDIFGIFTEKTDESDAIAVGITHVRGMTRKNKR